MRRGLVCLLLLAGVCPLWAALAPRYGGDLTLAVAGALPSSTSSLRAAAVGRLVFGLVHETLVGVGPDGFPVPALAKSWVSTSDGHEWTLSVDTDARFHDDTAVTAEDAARSLRLFLGSDSAPARRLTLSLAADGILAKDASHLVLRFAEPGALPLAPLAAAAIIGARGAGAGPFVPTHEIPGSRLALTAFSSDARGRPYLDRISIVTLPDAARLRGALAAGQVDMALGEPGVSALAGTLLLILDPGRPPFDQREARGTVAAAVDPDEIVKRLWPGGDPTPSLLTPGVLPALGGAERRGPARSFAGPLSFAVSTEVPPLVSQRVVAHLDALGFRMSVQALEPAAARHADAAARLIVFVPEVPEAALALRELASLAPCGTEAKAVLAAAERERDMDRRRSLLYRAEASLRAEACLIPLASVPLSVGIRAGLEGVRVDAFGRVVLEDTWLAP